MKCYIVMAMLLAICLDVSEGKQGDCEKNNLDGRTNCELYCGFTTSWSACNNNICCCGYDNRWHAFRFDEGEKCDGDPSETPTIRCNPQMCQEACGGAYSCAGSLCMCPFLYENHSLGWRNKISWWEDGTAHYFD